MNKVILFGTVSDRPLPGVKAKDSCGFSLVLSRSLPGWSSPHLDYVPVMAYGRTAEFCRAHLTKDLRILLEGRLTRDRWYSPRSGPRSRLLVVAERIECLTEAQAQAPPGPAPPTAPDPVPAAPPASAPAPVTR